MTKPRTPGALRRVLVAEGVPASSITEVRLKKNRHHHYTLSADGVLHLHVAFARAPRKILRAIAQDLTAREGSRRQREARRTAIKWEGFVESARRIRDADPSLLRSAFKGYHVSAAPGKCDGTPEQIQILRRAYRHYNRTRFNGILPDTVPIRLSGKLEVTYGYVVPAFSRSGKRIITELVLNLDLVLSGNEQVLIDTLLHEMAHIAAWIRNGDAGHGKAWKRWTQKVGCNPLACEDVHMRRRRGHRCRSLPQIPGQRRVA